MLFLFNILKDSVQSELDDFFGRIEASDTRVHKVSNSAFTQARRKLKHSAFIELDSVQVDHFYSNTNYHKWNGFRLAAIDGSTAVIPSTPETQKKFGVSEVKKSGVAVVLARISEAFDPLNHITLDAAIQPYKVDEGTMMIWHLEKLNKGDLALYDRNYPSFWGYKLHQKKGVHFCMRVQAKGRGKVIEDFVASGAKDMVVEISCTTDNSRNRCAELGLGTACVKCRLLKIELKSGETEVLVTSLLDTELFQYECFEELYHLRWPVEEDYKLLKCRLEIENFSGKSNEAVQQDFFAKIFMANLTSILAFDANIELEEKTEHRKLDYKINWSNAIGNMKKSAALLFVRTNVDDILDSLHSLFQVQPVAIRPNRTFERFHGKNKRRFSMCYK